MCSCPSRHYSEREGGPRHWEKEQVSTADFEHQRLYSPVYAQRLDTNYWKCMMPPNAQQHLIHDAKKIRSRWQSVSLNTLLEWSSSLIQLPGEDLQFRAASSKDLFGSVGVFKSENKKGPTLRKTNLRSTFAICHSNYIKFPLWSAFGIVLVHSSLIMTCSAAGLFSVLILHSSSRGQRQLQGGYNI